MRRVITILTMAAVWGGLGLFGMAADPKANKSPEAVKVETRTATSVNAGLRAEIHRTMAALIEAQAAEEPDPAQIEKLTQQLQDLRGKLRAQKAAVVGNQAGGTGYPWGGPGRGFGRGAGRGAGGGRGLGPGAGQGLAPGGPAYVDHDNDGICDYYELRHGLHQ